MQMFEFRCHTIGQLCDLLHDNERWRIDRFELPAARIVQVIANVNRDTDSHREPFTLEEIAPWIFPPKSEEQLAQEHAEHLYLKGIAMMHNLNRGVKP